MDIFKTMAVKDVEDRQHHRPPAAVPQPVAPITVTSRLPANSLASWRFLRLDPW